MIISGTVTDLFFSVYIFTKYFYHSAFLLQPVFMICYRIAAFIRASHITYPLIVIEPETEQNG